MFHKIKKNQLKFGGKSLDLSTPTVMGILNLTNDSFYDGGKYRNTNKLIDQTHKMLDEGATIIDVGAASSNPNSKPISIKEEWKRLKPFCEIINKEFPKSIFSIDTYHSEIAKKAIDCGINIINDISAGQIDAKMFDTVVETKAPYIMMHMKGTPQTMQKLTNYDNIVDDIFNFFQDKTTQLKQRGVSNIIIDLGFGFGKTINQNYKLLNKMSEFQEIGLPILAGISRKSMVYKALDLDPKQALNGTTALNMLCLTNGASILRVHDVKQAMECIKLFNFAQNNK